MGATTFETYWLGTSPQEAFNEAVQQAQYESGHDGYTGTIAEKNDFVMIKVPTDWHKGYEAYVDHLINESDPRIEDKWGPAGCILIESKPMREELAYATTAERYKQDGTRKWETVYVVQAMHYRKECSSQTEAEQLGKDYCKKHGETVTISIEKKLVNGQAQIITIRPKTKEVQSKKTMNKYLFFGWASS